MNLPLNTQRRIKLLFKIIFVTIFLAITTVFFELVYFYLLENALKFKNILIFSLLFSLIIAFYLTYVLYYWVISFSKLKGYHSSLKKASFTDIEETSLKNKDIKPEDAKWAYEKLLQVRDLDNQLIWKRIDMLIVFQGVLLGAIAAGFDKLIQYSQMLLFALIFIGLFSSLVLHQIARGGSWWVTHWQQLLADLESFAIGDICIFRNHHPYWKSEDRPLWKTTGYVSTRDWIRYFTFTLPFIWAAIAIIVLNINS